MRQLYPAVEHLDISARLPLIELLLPALKCMSPEQYKRFQTDFIATDSS